METMGWTDEKIDALAGGVHRGFARADVEFARIDERFKSVDQRFDAVDRRFDRVGGDMKAGFARMDAKFDALHRLLLQLFGGLIGTLIAGVVTLIALH